MRRISLVVICGLTQSACGLMQQAQYNSLYQEAQSNLSADLAACRKQYPARVKGQAAASMRCSNAAYARNSAAMGGGYNGDLVTLAGAKAVEASERYDAGSITETQLDVELAQIQAEFQGGSQARQAQALTVGAAQQQANAARQQAAIQQMATGAAIMAGGGAPPIAPPPMPRHTNCSTYGANTNCSTW